MNIVILTGSVRRGGNTDQLVGAFVEGLGGRQYGDVAQTTAMNQARELGTRI